ncbi:MAG: hypothetical protein ABW168_06660 [Sedimenticola sp.]
MSTNFAVARKRLCKSIVIIPLLLFFYEANAACVAQQPRTFCGDTVKLGMRFSSPPTTYMTISTTGNLYSDNDFAYSTVNNNNEFISRLRNDDINSLFFVYADLAWDQPGNTFGLYITRNSYVETLPALDFILDDIDFFGPQLDIIGLTVKTPNGYDPIFSSFTNDSLFIQFPEITFASLQDRKSIKFELETGLSPIPIPAAAWLFGSSLMGFFFFKSRRRTA